MTTRPDSGTLTAEQIASYRVAGAFALLPDHPRWDDLTATFSDEARADRPDGFGLVFLDSKLMIEDRMAHSLMYVTSPAEVITRLELLAAGQPPPPYVLGSDGGVLASLWPSRHACNGWDDILPTKPWHEDGKGVLIEYEHRGTKVVVYEYVDDDPRWPHERLKVTYHCQFCHMAGSSNERYLNEGPFTRWLAADAARKHIRYADVEHNSCQPLPASWDRVVATVTNTPGFSGAAQCEASMQCATIRHVRAVQAANGAKP